MNAMLKSALLFIPILSLTGLSLLHEHHRSTGTVWTVPIDGYDPRDLLSGHYLRFQYLWNVHKDTSASTCSGADCAMCTDDAAQFNPGVRFVPLAEAPQACASFIAGNAYNENQFYIRGARDNLQRYYIPERDAERLQTLFITNESNAPKFSMHLRVTNNGIAYIERMYVDDIALEEWLQTHQD